VNALVLMTLLAAADAPVITEPQLHVVAQLGATGGARAVLAPEEPFFAGLDGMLGLRFDPIRFGLFARGLFSTKLGLDVGGFFTVDAVRVKLDSKRSVALFTGVDVLGRWVPARPSPWSTVLLGHLGVRVLGISVAVAGGGEIPSGLGELEVRLGVDFVELFAN